MKIPVYCPRFERLVPHEPHFAEARRALHEPYRLHPAGPCPGVAAPEAGTYAAEKAIGLLRAAALAMSAPERAHGLVERERALAKEGKAAIEAVLQTIGRAWPMAWEAAIRGLTPPFDC